MVVDGKCINDTLYHGGVDENDLLRLIVKGERYLFCNVVARNDSKQSLRIIIDEKNQIKRVSHTAQQPLAEDEQVRLSSIFTLF